MVVTRPPTADEIGVEQERIGAPSRCTVQAPHSAMPQPNLVPVRLRWSRSTHSSGTSASTSARTCLPFTLRVSMHLVLCGIASTPWCSLEAGRTMTESALFMTKTSESNDNGRGYVAPDLLSDSLALLRIRGQVGSRTEAKAPWGLQLPQSDSYFHVIERGSCSLQLDGAVDAIRLEAGDAVILPHGHPHRLSDAPDRKVVPLAKALESQRDGVLRLGANGAATDIICGAFRFDSAAGHPLLESLPPL